MSDVPNRDELERRLARILGGINRTHLTRLLEALGDPPSLDNLPPDFWDEAGAELEAALRPFLEGTFRDSAERMLAATPAVGVDWTLVNRRAAEWARRYTFDLVRGINDTSRTALQEYVGGYYQNGETMGELVDRLGSLYGPVRAEMIAVTEVTRASSGGEQEIAAELREQGIEMIPVWQTNNDELVCELCGPKHDKRIEDGMYPPEHPRCRCWVNHELRAPDDND